MHDNIVWFIPFFIFWQRSYKNTKILQGVKGESGKSLSSKFGQNQCLYYNKQYISKKPWISALIWHPESACIFKIDFWRGHRRHEVKNRPRAHKIQQNMPFTARGGGGLLIMPRPLSGC